MKEKDMLPLIAVDMYAHRCVEKMFLDNTLRSITSFTPDGKGKVKMSRSSNDKNAFHLCYGKPNHREREYLKRCKRIGVPPTMFEIHFAKVTKV
jgi:hypothetical protein